MDSHLCRTIDSHLSVESDDMGTTACRPFLTVKWQICQARSIDSNLFERVATYELKLFQCPKMNKMLKSHSKDCIDQ